MVRRSVVILLCIVGLIASGVAAVSGDEPDYSARQWEEVFEEFDLEPAAEVPGGVTPLVVTSPGELRKLLAGAPPSRMEFHVSASDLQDLSALMTGELLGLTETYVELHATNSHEWPVIFHLYAKVWMIGSGSFWQITECNERVYFTGWLPWISWISGDTYLISKKQRCLLIRKNQRFLLFRRNSGLCYSA